MENNKLIVDFMGWEQTNIAEAYYTPFFTAGVYISEMPFNREWNWLMSVVDKINELGIGGGIMYDLRDALTGANIDLAYIEIVNIIKWYNGKIFSKDSSS